MKKFFKSFGFALRGIGLSLREQMNLKIQLIIALITIALGFYFSITSTEWCIILLSTALVLGFEMINTAIESLVDLVTLERKPLAGKIKDIAAGAVLLAAALSLIVGVIVFKKYFFPF